MPNLNMCKEAYLFTSEEVDRQITKKQAGNYALGYIDEKNNFFVQYVGRSDSDVNNRIKDHLNKKYTHFKFSYGRNDLVGDGHGRANGTTLARVNVGHNSDLRGRKRLGIAYRLYLLTRSILKGGGEALCGVKSSYNLYHVFLLSYCTVGHLL